MATSYRRGRPAPCRTGDSPLASHGVSWRSRPCRRDTALRAWTPGQEGRPVAQSESCGSVAWAGEPATGTGSQVLQRTRKPRRDCTGPACETVCFGCQRLGGAEPAASAAAALRLSGWDIVDETHTVPRVWSEMDCFLPSALILGPEDTTEDSSNDTYQNSLVLILTCPLGGQVRINGHRDLRRSDRKPADTPSRRQLRDRS
jgi:hypothetical protein